MNHYNYFTEVEEHFVRRRGKHLFVSPMDWSLIATWRDSGVPLHVALRGIDRAMDGFFARQPLRDSRIGSLFYCHSAVMEEYARYLESHVGEAQPVGDAVRAPQDPSAGQHTGAPDKTAILEFLDARILEIKGLSGKLPVSEGVREGIPRLVARLEEIRRTVATGSQVDCEALDRDLGILDGTLIGELKAALTADQIAAWEQEARQELKIYRKKLPKATYDKILSNFMRTKIHRHFAVGELSLFHM